MKGNLSGRKIGCIHAAVFTASIVQKYFDEILPEVKVYHLGDDTIQKTNLEAPVGTIPKENFFRFATYAHFLEEAGVELILLGCSTFNQAVEFARPMINVPLLQIDRTMMDMAVRQGSRVGLLATLPSTVPSSERLLRIAAEDAGKSIEIKTVLCGEAFRLLKAGSKEKHNELLLREIDQLSQETDVIVLSQVSMTALEPYLCETRVPILNSGRTSVMRIRDILMSNP